MSILIILTKIGWQIFDQEGGRKMITIVTETQASYKQSSMLIFGPEMPSEVKVELILSLDKTTDEKISVLSQQIHDLFVEILGKEEVELKNFTEHGYRNRTRGPVSLR